MISLLRCLYEAIRNGETSLLRLFLALFWVSAAWIQFNTPAYGIENVLGIDVSIIYGCLALAVAVLMVLSICISGKMIDKVSALVGTMVSVLIAVSYVVVGLQGFPAYIVIALFCALLSARANYGL